MLTKYFDIQMYLYIFIYRLHKNEVNLDLGRKKIVNMINEVIKNKIKMSRKKNKYYSKNLMMMYY